MYRIGVKESFAAAHYLAGYQGSCEALHGHNYAVEAVVESASTDETGLALDFRQLKSLLRRSLDRLDHTLLNESPVAEIGNPSSENIARWVYESLAALLPPGVRLRRITVWETDDAWASYGPDKSSTL